MFQLLLNTFVSWRTLIFLRFYLLKTFKIYARRFLKKLKIYLRLILIKILCFLLNSVCYCSPLYVNNNNCFSLLFHSLHPLHKQYQLLDSCSTDLCKWDLPTNIILFKRTASLHKTDWTSLLQSPALPCLLYCKVNSLMNVVEGKCLWLCFPEISKVVVYVYYLL